MKRQGLHISVFRAIVNGEFMPAQQMINFSSKKKVLKPDYTCW